MTVDTSLIHPSRRVHDTLAELPHMPLCGFDPTTVSMVDAPDADACMLPAEWMLLEDPDPFKAEGIAFSCTAHIEPLALCFGSNGQQPDLTIKRLNLRNLPDLAEDQALCNGWVPAIECSCSQGIHPCHALAQFELVDVCHPNLIVRQDEHVYACDSDRATVLSFKRDEAPEHVWLMRRLYA